METFAKIGFAKFLLLHKKSELPKIWEGGKVQGHHQIISNDTLIKNFFSTKTVFSAYFIGLLI